MPVPQTTQTVTETKWYDTCGLFTDTVRMDDKHIVKQLRCAGPPVQLESPAATIRHMLIAPDEEHSYQRMVEIDHFINQTRQAERVEIVQWLRKNNFVAGFEPVDVASIFNDPRHNGDYPIFTAIQQEDAIMIHYMIYHGADLQVKNGYGLTPLAFACLCAENGSHRDILKAFAPLQ